MLSAPSIPMPGVNPSSPCRRAACSESLCLAICSTMGIGRRPRPSAATCSAAPSAFRRRTLQTHGGEAANGCFRRTCSYVSIQCSTGRQCRAETYGMQACMQVHEHAVKNGQASFKLEP